MDIRLGVQLILAIGLPLLVLLWACMYENRNFLKKIEKTS